MKLNHHVLEVDILRLQLVVLEVVHLVALAVLGDRGQQPYRTLLRVSAVRVLLYPIIAVSHVVEIE